MKVKGKAKQLFCMACVFVASFLVTVTAFAASTYGTVNPNWYGTYICSKPSLSSSKIIVKDVDNCDIVAYFDNRPQYRTYFSGNTDDYVLTPSAKPPFSANFDKVNQVSSSGNPVKQNGVIVIENDYLTTGSVKSLGYKFICSDDSGLIYMLQD